MMGDFMLRGLRLWSTSDGVLDGSGAQHSNTPTLHYSGFVLARGPNGSG
jgi:hypothetical protein